MDLNDRLKRIVNEGMTPALKAAGFKKKGNKFFLEEERLEYVTEIQKSRWNTKEKCEFTLNYDIWTAKKIREKLPYALLVPGLSGRVADITKDLQEWFILSVDVENPIDHDQKIIEELSEKQIPVFLKFIQKIKDERGIIDLIENEEKYRWNPKIMLFTAPLPAQKRTWLCLLYFIVGNKEKSLEILSDMLRTCEPGTFKSWLLEKQQQIQSAEPPVFDD